MTKIFIVDDHSLIREGFRRIIESNKDMIVAGEAGNAKDFFKRFDASNCDLVVLDINLPDKNGLEVLKDIKAINPEMPVLILSMYPEHRYALRTFKAGASGYISKENAGETLIKAIRKIIRGGKYISEELGEELAANLHNENQIPHKCLSDREYQVFLLIGTGNSINQISQILSLSINTINTYRNRIFDKMNLKSNADIILYAMRNNLLE